MLREVAISNFKCFESLVLPLAPLTLLSGINGGGKSTVVQALALLSQSMNEREWGRALMLEGQDLALGNAAEVLNQRAARRGLSLGARGDRERIVWAFEAADRRDLSLNLASLEIDATVVDATGPLRWLVPAERAVGSEVVTAIRGLSWITAERTGPRELLPLRDAHGHLRVGARGDLAAGLLHWRGEEPVQPEVCVDGEPATLLHQVRAHMQVFFPGSDLQVVAVDHASAVTLRLRLDKGAEFQRPQNVGFGLTQLFPVIVAALAAKPGDLLLVENPEVHLHPGGQQAIGALLARVARCGVQIVVETHSDHVLNGVRLAVKKREIQPESVALHFFGQGAGPRRFEPKSPVIDQDGRLDSWPEGFFDQFDRALSELL